MKDFKVFATAKGLRHRGGAPREVMDIREAADYLGLSPDTLYKYAGEGSVPAFKLGNRWRFRKERLDKWMENKIQERQKADG